MLYTFIGDLPQHQYAFVDSTVTHKTAEGFVPCIWFGIVSYPGRVWGCNVLFKNGAVYRNVPIHALAWKANPDNKWTPQDAQTWDCYGYAFSALAYASLKDVVCQVRTKTNEYRGHYLFTVAPMLDAWSARPEQAKEFSFIALDNGRYTVQPTNQLLMVDASFVKPQWPTDMKIQTDTYSCEN